MNLNSAIEYLRVMHHRGDLIQENGVYVVCCWQSRTAGKAIDAILTAGGRVYAIDSEDVALPDSERYSHRRTHYITFYVPHSIVK